ncbi:MAG TPA: hypothetical protein VJ183_20475 [Chloroflexia bacterium]|nr:hypothetical protein [Chloroflexia bacterium]
MEENDRPLFQGIDEFERTYAPQELPPDDPDQTRVHAEEGSDATAQTLSDIPEPAPVANMGNAPSAAAAPPNIGHEYHGGAPGDPNTEARNPLDTDESPEDRR